MQGPPTYCIDGETIASIFVTDVMGCSHAMLFGPFSDDVRTADRAPVI